MSQQFRVFALATLLVNLTPGNDVIYVISRSAGQGVKAIGKWLSRNPRFIRVQEKVTGLVLIVLGIKVALTSKK